MSAEDYIAAIAALYGARGDDDLCAPFLVALPVTAAAICTLAEPFGSETVCASDPVAARLSELEIDLGEGPGREAMRTGRPVLEPDVQATASDRWPVALMALRESELGAVFAFPMHVGALQVGAVLFYNDAAGSLPERALQDASALTSVAARLVLHTALLRSESDNEGTNWETSHYSRREVHQAAGVLTAQSEVDVDDALLLLRAHAFTAGRTVRDLASDVIAGTVTFTDRNDTAT